MNSKRGAPEGNDNAHRGREFHQALKRALAREANQTDYRKGLDLVASQLAKAAIKGEQWAVTMVADREDGKAIQMNEISGPGGGPVSVQQWQLQPVKPAPRPEREQRRKG